MSSANLHSEWARLPMGSLADAGVRHVVVSPGSRSTPLVLAAAGEPRFVLQDVLDERAAGFVALERRDVAPPLWSVVCQKPA